MPNLVGAAPRTLRVFGIAGSLRAGSYNRALLRAARALAPPGLEIAIFDGLREIPPYDADVDAAGEPAPVAALRRAIREADALLVATPEYNYGVPGVLKNVIDWASRPAGRAALRRKAAGILGASTGASGTMRAQLALRQSFNFTETYAMLRPEVFIAHAGEKFDAAGELTGEATRDHLRQFLAAFEAWARQFAAPAS
ncbi:MAG TPA: NADPH-dependent FMN reductase [Thermoanaerobaculia bacterium]|nr:NADPH-dependent FMN reductase [Thermoanaerobaculia bacterium]